MQSAFWMLPEPLLIAETSAQSATWYTTSAESRWTLGPRASTIEGDGLLTGCKVCADCTYSTRTLKHEQLSGMMYNSIRFRRIV